MAADRLGTILHTMAEAETNHLTLPVVLLEQAVSRTVHKNSKLAN